MNFFGTASAAILLRLLRITATCVFLLFGPAAMDSSDASQLAAALSDASCTEEHVDEARLAIWFT